MLAHLLPELGRVLLLYLITDVEPEGSGGECVDPAAFSSVLRSTPLAARMFPILISQSIPTKLMAMARHVGDISNSSISIQEIRGHLKVESSISGAEVLGSKLLGCIEFRDVTFAYPRAPRHKIFDRFSLIIDPGQVCALVGPSGSGKSTTVSLVERFYDPTSGEILMDGINLKQFQLSWLRSQIGLVSQEPVLFDGTVHENIELGKDGATADDVTAAARKANAHEFISLLPDGYETQVGTRGSSLSGG